MSIRKGSVDLQTSTAKCPVCGNMGHIQDGLYDTVLGVVQETARIFRSLTLEEAATLAEALEKTRQGEVNEDAAVEAVVEATPAKAKSWIKKVLGKADKKFWASILLSVLVAVQSNLAGDSSTQSLQESIVNSNQTVQQQVMQISRQDEHLRQLVQELLTKDSGESQSVRGPAVKAQPPTTSAKPPAELPSRNQLCWCGSGRKYKRCHRNVGQGLNLPVLGLMHG